MLTNKTALRPLWTVLTAVAMVTAGVHHLGALADPERTQPAAADDPSMDAERAVVEAGPAAGAQAYGSSLIGWQVVTDTEAAVGPVRDLIYDLGDGAVAYLVVATGGEPPQALVLPYTLGAVDPSARRFVVAAQATAHLGTAPRFGMAIVQTTAFDAPAQWARPAERYWYAPTGVMTQLRQRRGQPMMSRRGLTPYGGVRIRRATLFSHSALAGRRLLPGEMAEGATLSDTVIDRSTGSVRYVAVTLDVGRVLALPIEALSVATARETVAIGRIASLEGAPGELVLGDSRHLADVAWPRIEQYWSQNIPGLGLRGTLVVNRFNVRASTLADLAVYPDFGGLLLGHVDDLVIGAAGRIDYVVLATDEPLGAGRRVLIPMSFLALGQSFEHALADVTGDEIGDLPALPDGVFPATARIGWDTVYRTYWGAPDHAVAATTTGQQPFLLSSLIGSNVTRPDGAPLALVEDLIIDLQAGIARYALLAPVDVAVASGDATSAVVPIDLIVFTIDPDGTPQPVSEVTPTRLLAAPHFDADDPTWERRARTYWRD